MRPALHRDERQPECLSSGAEPWDSYFQQPPTHTDITEFAGTALSVRPNQAELRTATQLEHGEEAHILAKVGKPRVSSDSLFEKVQRELSDRFSDWLSEPIDFGADLWVIVR